MSDLFHENVQDEWIDKIFAVMALCPQHTFQVLTKRASRAWDYWFLTNRTMRLFWIAQAIDELFPQRTHQTIAAKQWLIESDMFPLTNVLHGFSAENQETFDKRWNVICRLAGSQMPTFCSAEPLLGPIDMGNGRLPGWVIVGGESGPGARPMHPDWVRSLRNQCQASGTPFFFKQHGEWISLADYDAFLHGFKAEKYQHQFAWKAGSKNDEELPVSCYRVGKKAAGALLDGREWREFPEVKHAGI
jgi:protein gp37